MAPNTSAIGLEAWKLDAPLVEDEAAAEPVAELKPAPEVAPADVVAGEPADEEPADEEPALEERVALLIVVFLLITVPVPAVPTVPTVPTPPSELAVSAVIEAFALEYVVGSGAGLVTLATEVVPEAVMELCTTVEPCAEVELEAEETAEEEAPWIVKGPK